MLRARFPLPTDVNSSGATSGRAVEVSNRTGGTVTLSGNFTDDASTGGRFLFANNSGGTTNITGNVTMNSGAFNSLIVTNSANHAVTFSGTNTDIDTTSGTAVVIDGGGGTINFNSAGINTVNSTTGDAFVASGGGTVVIGGTANLTSTTGRAVAISSTTIGVAGVTLRSVSANGAVNGIVLNGTGSTGAFTVTGTGTTAGSGGTIQNTTGSSVLLTNVTGVSISNMNITNSGLHGIQGTNVTNLDLTGVIISGSGNALNEHGIFLTNLLGTGASSSNFHDLQVLNSDGDTAILIHQTAAGTGELLIDGASRIEDAREGGFEVRTQNNGATFNVTIGDASALGAGDTVLIDNAVIGAAFFAEQGAITATVRNSNIIDGGGIGSIVRAGSGASGVGFTGVTGQSTSATGQITLTVTGNNIDIENAGAGGTGSAGVALGGSGNVNGTISNNTIDSNDEFVDGVFTNFTGVGTAAQNKILIDNNTINMVGSGGNETIAGIDINASDSTGGLSVTITNNTITSAGDNGFSAGIVAISGDLGGGDSNTLCVDITGNSVSTPNLPLLGVDGNDYVFVSFTGTTTQIEGAPLGVLSEAQIDTYIAGVNAGATVATDINVFTAGGAFNGVGTCP